MGPKWLQAHCIFTKIKRKVKCDGFNFHEMRLSLRVLLCQCEPDLNLCLTLLLFMSVISGWRLCPGEGTEPRHGSGVLRAWDSTDTASQVFLAQVLHCGVVHRPAGLYQTPSSCSTLAKPSIQVCPRLPRSSGCSVVHSPASMWICQEIYLLLPKS